MIEQADIVSIEEFPSGHTAFFTTQGTWACSCGTQCWTPDLDYIRISKWLVK